MMCAGYRRELHQRLVFGRLMKDNRDLEFLQGELKSSADSLQLDSVWPTSMEKTAFPSWLAWYLFGAFLSLGPSGALPCPPALVNFIHLLTRSYESQDCLPSPPRAKGPFQARSRLRTNHQDLVLGP